MRKFKNRQLTKNISLYECIEAHPLGDPVFKQYAWDGIYEFDYDNMVAIASKVQQLRNKINEKYRKRNNGREITVKITSAFRPLVWEQLKGRIGTSQHAQSTAIDFQPSDCSNSLAVEIINYLHTYLADNGYRGGLAIKRPTYDDMGNITRIGFLHLDNRGHSARWSYP